jgi:hypothetical protein
LLKMILTERLLINGSPLPVSGWNIQAPKDGMGRSVTIALAKPDPGSIPVDADVTFEIGASVWNGASYDTSYAPPIIEGGRLNGRSYTVRWIPDERGGFPGDVIEFSSLSPMADRWSICPELPVIVFDPAKVKESSIKFRDADLIREYGDYEGGYRLLTPEKESTPDLNLHRIIDRCYKDGCGFTRVVTNLPNPPIDRLDISVESGYHAAVLPLMQKVALHLLVSELDNILYIFDPSRGIPSTFPVKELGLDCVVEKSENINPEVLSNAVILSYRQDPGGTIYIGERAEPKIIDLETVESPEGGEGTPSYTKQDGYRRVTEFYDIVTNELRRVEEHEIVTRLYGYPDIIEVDVQTVDGEEVVTRTRTPQVSTLRLLARETTSNTYTGNTKAGHTRTVEGYYSNPETRGIPEFGEILRETNTSTWTVDLNHPGESILKRSVTRVSGLCLREALKDGYLVYTPITDADEGGLIKSDLSQGIEVKPIETVIEELVETGINQANVETRIIDHLQGRPRKTGIQGRPGSRSTYFPNFALPQAKNGYIREIIKDEDSVALYGLRKPTSLDVDRLGAVEGRILARRKLEYLKEPPKNVAITLPGIDFSITRGSLVKPPLRVFATGAGSIDPIKFIVEAFNITASGIGTEQARYTMRLDCLEVKDAG